MALAKPAATAALGLYKAYRRLRSHFADSVEDLIEGSVVYQNLDLPVPGLGGVFDHSGIYVGDHRVVSLSGDGGIIEQGTANFIEGGWNRPIWASCKGGLAVGKPSVAKLARKKVGESREYNILFDNCHQFTSGCLTGDFESADNFLTFLKDTVRRELGADNWRVWDRDGAIQQMCNEAIREMSRDRRLLKELIAADFDRRTELLGSSFDRLEKSYAIKDANGFLDSLAAIAKSYGGELPWRDFESFDEWMQDDDTVLKL